MSNKCLVSVVMAEYNTNPNYLIAAVESILNQTFTNFEFIIVDDCGYNDVELILSKYNDDRIKIIKNHKNMGLVYSLNTAIKQARGKYIVRMDGDDVSLPQRIDILYDFIHKHPEYSVVGSRVIEFSETGEHGITGKSGEKTKRSIMRGNIIIHPSTIMQREIIIGIDGYKNFKRAEDLALWCDLLLDGNRLCTIEDVLLQYRVNRDDYKKRKITNRMHEIKARISYYPRMGANVIDYLYILKSIASGILPVTIVRAYRSRFVMDDIKPKMKGNYHV